MPQQRMNGLVWVVTRIETSARNYGPIERIFAQQADGEAFATQLNETNAETGANDIVYDCSAFTLWGGRVA